MNQKQQKDKNYMPTTRTNKEMDTFVDDLIAVGINYLLNLSDRDAIEECDDIDSNEEMSFEEKRAEKQLVRTKRKIESVAIMSVMGYARQKIKSEMDSRRRP